MTNETVPEENSRADREIVERNGIAFPPIAQSNIIIHSVG